MSNMATRHIITIHGASPRELEVLAALASGRSRGEAAEVLSISELTVKSHLARLSRRLGIRSVAGLVAWAVRKRLLNPHEGDWPALRPTDSQLGVLTLVADGLTNEQVGKRLFLAEDTVKTHLKRSGDRLHVRSRAAQVAVCLAKGWIE